jgi:hypothetical protein
VVESNMVPSSVKPGMMIVTKRSTAITGWAG